MKMTVQETALITYLRGLCFDDLLDATEGIVIKSANAAQAAINRKVSGDIRNADGFMERAKILDQLADLLGDANADYRAHVTPDESRTPFAPYMPGVSKMQDSSEAEVIHLFEVMKKYGTKCSLEFQSDGILDPLLAISNYPIELIEYFESSSGPDSVLLELGDIGFNFQIGKNQYMKDISDCQILICIASDNYAAWFNSAAIPPEGIEEAKNYKEIDSDDVDQEIHLNAGANGFEGELQDLKNLLDMGQVIKSAVVNGEGNQTLTIGWYRELEQTNGL